MKTKIVNMHRSSCDVKIDRTTPYGNPYQIPRDGNRNMVVARHQAWLMMWLKEKREVIIQGYNNKWVCEHVHELKGKILGCWCKPKRCHGDNLIWLLDYLKNN